MCNFSKWCHLLSWFFNFLQKCKAALYAAESQGMITKYRMSLQISIFALTREIFLDNSNTFIPILLFYGPSSFFFHHVSHCKWGPASKIAVLKSFQSCGLIYFLIAHELNICFRKGKHIPYEMPASFSLFKSNNSMHSQVMSA